MTSEIEKSLEKNWVWDEGDPEEIHVLEEEIASGSFGSVYKVRAPTRIENWPNSHGSIF
jgi:hypothetical protein